MVRKHEQKNVWRKSSRISEGEFEQILIAVCQGRSPPEIADQQGSPILQVRDNYDYILEKIFRWDFVSGSNYGFTDYISGSCYSNLTHWMMGTKSSTARVRRCVFECPLKVELSNFRSRSSSSNCQRQRNDNNNRIARKAHCPKCPINFGGGESMKIKSVHKDLKEMLELHRFLANFYARKLTRYFPQIMNIFRVSRFVLAYLDWVRYAYTRLKENGIQIEQDAFLEYNMSSFLDTLLSNMRMSLNHEGAIGERWDATRAFYSIFGLHASTDERDDPERRRRYEIICGVPRPNQSEDDPEYLYRKDYLTIIGGGRIFKRVAA